MKFLLDTTICIHALRQDRRVLDRLLAQQRSDVAVSIITEAELRAGAAGSTSGTKTVNLVENFLRPLSILEFIAEDAAAYARVREKLVRAENPVGPLDVLIAAQAVARKLVLVSTNEFGRIGGLRVENWAA